MVTNGSTYKDLEGEYVVNPFIYYIFGVAARTDTISAAAGTLSKYDVSDVQ